MRYSVLAVAALASSAFASTFSECETANNACVTAPGANFSYCGAQHASCLASATTSTASDCMAQNNACVTAPGANFAFCAGQKATCLAAASSASTPSATASASTASSSVTTSTGRDCEAQNNACVTTPGANFAFCAGQKATCLAAASSASTQSATASASTQSSVRVSASGTGVSKPTFTPNAASVAKPVYGMLALGALALL